MKTLPTDTVPSAAVNPGETLRQTRELKGLSVADVAAQLNLTKQRLMQIEAGAFDKLPGTTFARGYIRAYAKFLGLDPNRLVIEFDQFTGSVTEAAEVHSLKRIEEPVRYSQGILRWVSFALLAALGVGGFFWWQEQGRSPFASNDALTLEQVEVEGADGTTQIHSLAEPEDQALEDAKVQTVEVEPVAPQADQLAAAPAASEAPAQAEPAQATETNTAEVEQRVPSAPVQTAAPEAVVATQAPAVVPEPLPAPAVAGGQGNVRVNFTADCWTQVTDATGKVLISALKRTGEQIDVTGQAPLELRLGFARGAQVTYNGEAVNVSAHTSGETARLKLGQ